MSGSFDRGCAEGLIFSKATRPGAVRLRSLGRDVPVKILSGDSVFHEILRFRQLRSLPKPAQGGHVNSPIRVAVSAIQLPWSAL